ncbi:cation diffusion facilitator family transporter [Parabacteroides sp. FAFU027]|uniref:cation diffusion facilitator family transporter n=1 Tax=Parabacteroides sp. FAFU027 TaxID=2922715 RepID=UPI001FB02F90|nr:cation diffusion facilitator family transporter [Parabacteroides sp. FAFU027]
MVHDHEHHHEINLDNAFKIGIALNIVFTIIEVVYGYLANSMALVADAGHNFSDVLALAFSWIGVILSQRKPTLRFTYGFRRSTILIALLNTVLLLVAIGFILWETIHRLGKPLEIKSQDVILVAAIGIVINGFTAWLFVKGKKNDLNIRSAFVHFVADALVSLGVVVAGVIIAFTGITWIDSVVSFIIIAVILYSTVHLLIDSVNLGLDAVPEHIDIEVVRKYLEALPEVSTIHDLHIWALSTTDAALTVHLNTCCETDNTFIYEVQKHLHNHFHIEHATIQIEQGDENCRNNCN